MFTGRQNAGTKQRKGCLKTMTSDAIQNHTHEDAAQNTWAGSLELTRNAGFVNGTQDIFDVLAQRDLQGIGKDKTQAAAALLRRAQDRMDVVEKQLAAQSHRIRHLENNLMIDELTGLYNHHGLQRALGREIARVRRNKSKNGLLLFIEIDNLLRIGQQHGREAVRACLKLVAQALQGEVRTMDIAARNGQEQFVLVFPDTQRDQAIQRVQKLALRMNNMSFIWNMEEVSINTSLHVKAYKAEDTAEDLIQNRVAVTPLHAEKPVPKTEMKKAR